MNLILGNASYVSHSTNEGNELQMGLVAQGWHICGPGFPDKENNVRAILNRHRPDAVFVQDARDWHASSDGSFGNRHLHFDHYDALAGDPCKKIIVVKDAGTAVEFQRKFAQDVKADTALVYYHDDAILKLSPWLADYKRVRIYHTVDAKLINGIDLSKKRKRAIVSGAVSRSVYPLRSMVFENAKGMGVDTLKHPGYSDKKTFTPEYLETLSNYKVHVATCSSYNFALRKIIESVACGCTPVTNLPAWDVLPEIDGALARINSDATAKDVRSAIDDAANQWRMDERMEWSRKAKAYYDWRESGIRMNKSIMEC